MDIVDYINEVDRSNREQEAACFIYTTSQGLQRKYTLLWVITEAGRFLYAKSPCPQ